MEDQGCQHTARESLHWRPPPFPTLFVVHPRLECPWLFDIAVEVVTKPQCERTQRAGRVVSSVEGVVECTGHKKALRVQMLATGRHGTGMRVKLHVSFPRNVTRRTDS